MTSDIGPHGAPRDTAAGIRVLEESTQQLIAAVEAMGVRLNTAQEMQTALAATMGRVEEQQKQQANQKRFNQWLMVLLSLIIALAAGLGFALYRIDQNNQQIKDVQDRTSNSVLCPLYGLLVDQIADLPANAADEDDDGVVTPQEKAELDRTIRVIRQGYSALGCAPPA